MEHFEKMKEITVLLTAAGNVFMPGITNCFKTISERDIRLIGADMNVDPTILNMFDAYYSVPRADDPNYVDALLDICLKEKVDILIPVMTAELCKLADNINMFEQLGTVVSISDLSSLEIANDKLMLFDYLSLNNIPCARYMPVNSLAEIDTVVSQLGYPKKRVCIKKTSGSGSRGFRILDESRSNFDFFMNEKPNSSFIRFHELKEILSEATSFPKLMAMEYLPGEEYTIDLVANKGNTIVCCCRKSLGMNDSIMRDGIVVNNLPAEILCKRVVKLLELDGIIGFDLRENAEGIPLIMECNPRITAGVSFFNLAGVNLPYLNIKRLLNEPFIPPHLKIGTIVRRRWQEMGNYG